MPACIPALGAEVLAGGDAAVPLQASSCPSRRRSSASGRISGPVSKRVVRRSGATRLLPATLRRLEPQAPRVAAAFSQRADCRAGGAAVGGEVPRGAADRMRAGSRLSGREPGYGRRAARQRLRRRDAAGPAVLRIAARAQRRSGDGARAGAADDRPAAAGALRRDHQQCWRLRVAPAPLRAAARGRSGVRGRREGVGREAARRSRVARGDRVPAAGRRAIRFAGRRDVSRVVPPRARTADRRASRARCCGCCRGCRSSS